MTPLSATQRAMVGIILDCVERLETFNWIKNRQDFPKGLFVADFLGVSGSQVAEVLCARSRVKSGKLQCGQCRIIREHATEMCMLCVLDEGHTDKHVDMDGVTWK